MATVQKCLIQYFSSNGFAKAEGRTQKILLTLDGFNVESCGRKVGCQLMPRRWEVRVEQKRVLCPSWKNNVFAGHRGLLFRKFQTPIYTLSTLEAFYIYEYFIETAKEAEGMQVHVAVPVGTSFRTHNDHSNQCLCYWVQCGLQTCGVCPSSHTLLFFVFVVVARKEPIQLHSQPGHNHKNSRANSG